MGPKDKIRIELLTPTPGLVSQVTFSNSTHTLLWNTIRQISRMRDILQNSWPRLKGFTHHKQKQEVWWGEQYCCSRDETKEREKANVMCKTRLDPGSGKKDKDYKRYLGDYCEKFACGLHVKWCSFLRFLKMWQCYWNCGDYSYSWEIYAKTLVIFISFSWVVWQWKSVYVYTKIFTQRDGIVWKS